MSSGQVMGAVEQDPGNAVCAAHARDLTESWNCCLLPLSIKLHGLHMLHPDMGSEGWQRSAEITF